MLLNVGFYFKGAVAGDFGIYSVRAFVNEGCPR